MLNLLAIEGQTVIMLVLLAVMVVVLIVLPMFTNKRRNKAINDLHSSLRPGDVVKTVGGIVGTITEIREISPVDKEMVVETGVGDRKSTMVFDVQAVYQVLSKVDAPVEPAPFEEKPEKAAEVANPTETPAEQLAEESLSNDAENAAEEKPEEQSEVSEAEPQPEENPEPKTKKPRAKKA